MGLTGTGYAVSGMGPQGPFLVHVSAHAEIEHFGHLVALVQKIEQKLGGPCMLSWMTEIPAAPLVVAPPPSNVVGLDGKPRPA